MAQPVSNTEQEKMNLLKIAAALKKSIAATVLLGNFFIISTALFAPNQAIATPASQELNPTEVSQIEAVVHDYLIKNPQVLVEATLALQKQTEAEEQKRLTEIKTLAIKYSSQIFDAKSPNHVVTGSLTPKVMVTEFFSYQCPICRLTSPILDQLRKNNQDVQFIFINWPFEGDDDIYAAKVAIASNKQGKFHAIHHLLMSSQEGLNKEKVNVTAQRLGLNMVQLGNDLKDENLEKALRANFNLAHDLKLTGVPVLFIANEKLTKINVVSGKTNIKDIQKAIDEVR